ncbi:hypothetical protein KIW84_052820 [Lathyrus oleraceus]|uniref:Uncharacterized protein n=1 Tax=Pisum sativum TaxID=3888 RepID=A0A9D5AFR6_PEA|nr:hypothetical protein KIW84_052820 [Pisum sativum]
MPLRYIVAALKDGDLEKLYVSSARVSPMNVIIPGFASVNPTLQPQEEDLKARSIKKDVMIDESLENTSTYNIDSEEAKLEGLKIEERKFGDYEYLRFILSRAEEQKNAKPWKKRVIVKMLGRNIGSKDKNKKSNTRGEKSIIGKLMEDRQVATLVTGLQLDGEPNKKGIVDGPDHRKDRNLEKNRPKDPESPRSAK